MFLNKKLCEMIASLPQLKLVTLQVLIKDLISFHIKFLLCSLKNKFVQGIEKATGRRLSGLLQQLLVYNKVWDFLKL